MGINGLIRNAARDPKQCARGRRNAQNLSTAPTALNPTTGQITLESYTSSALPGTGNVGRLIWITDTEDVRIDTGTGWATIGP